MEMCDNEYLIYIKFALVTWTDVMNTKEANAGNRVLISVMEYLRDKHLTTITDNTVCRGKKSSTLP